MSEPSTSELATKIIRSENKLTNIMTKCDITSAGQAFIDTSLDLFKDAQGRDPCVGMPSLGARNIVVQKIRLTNVISRPAGLPVGGTWDCHIINKACNNVIPVIKATGINQNLISYDNPVVASVYGGVTVLTAVAGTVLGQDNLAHNFGLDAAYFNADTSCRVIGKAHEVVNTTAKLTKQGNVIIYQKPTCSPIESMSAISYTDGLDPSVYGSILTYADDAGYGTPAQILNLPKSRSYAAEDGVYQTCTLNSTENMPGTDRQIGILLQDGKAAGQVKYVTTPSISVVNATTKSPNIPFLNWPLISPFSESGCYFQGLSYESTLQLTCCWLLESTPGRNQFALNTLTFMSPAYDPCCLEMYSRLAHALPCGVPVKDNAAGDWIKYVADAAEAVGMPGAKLLSTGGRILTKMANSFNTPKGSPTALTSSNNKNADNIRMFMAKHPGSFAKVNKPKKEI
jgi:hypothetical protein